MMRLTVWTCAFVLAPAVAYAEAGPLPPKIEMEVIGTFPGYQWAIPTSMNNRGEIVGYAGPTLHGLQDAFFWSRETGFQLIRERSVATDINERGQVTLGWVECNSGGESCGYRGAIWNARARTFDDLGALYPAAINNRGVVAGTCLNQERTAFGVCVAHPTGLIDEWFCERDFCTLWPAAINERGDVVGWRYIDSWTELETHGILLTKNGERSVLSDFAAEDINNRGIVVGGQRKPYMGGTWGVPAIWRKSGVQALSYWGGASSVNARGWTVGTIYPDGIPSYGTGFVWSNKTQSPVFLTPDEASTAVDINDRGDIVGTLGPLWDPKALVI